MIRGMTGYGRSSRERDGLRVTVEVRSVNHRYLEVKVRVPRVLAAHEQDLRRRVGRTVRRGRVDAAVYLDRPAGEPYAIRLNPSFIGEITEAARRLERDFGVTGGIDLATLLRFPEAICATPAAEGATEEETVLVGEVLDEALDAVNRMRAEEGRVIAADVAGRLRSVAALRGEIASCAVDWPSRARQRLEDRLAQLLSGDSRVNPDRVEQEVALMAERADITEELVRLEGYITQAEGLLDGDGGDTGKRLDFLLQEMSRETNTIGSKAADAAIGSLVVNLKLELERIREQAQNIE